MQGSHEGEGSGEGSRVPSGPARKYSLKQWNAIKARLKREGKWNPKKRTAPVENDETPAEGETPQKAARQLNFDAPVAIGMY